MRVGLGIASCLLMLAAEAVQASDALNYFKNYFVTGDYATAGVGLRGQGVNGFATGTITMTDVPAGADIVAAFLYWQTVETSSAPVAINGFFDGHAIVGAVLGNPQNPGCWSSGGTNGAASASGRVYRADVLRYLAIDNVNSVRIANGPHTVKLPDSGGSGNGNVIYTNGATLVVVYRMLSPANPAVAPLRAVVIYDGTFTLSKGSPAMSQTIGGFYQTAASPAARMTQIVSNGQPGFVSPLSVNGANLSSSPFVGAQGGRLDDATFPISLGANAASFSTTVSAGNNQTCLSWGAIVSSMTVQDTDHDGLLDTWELNGMHLDPGDATHPATFGGCADNGGNCVDLPHMGANYLVPDVFLEIDWFGATGGHVHKPKIEALAQVAAAFSGNGHGIKLHFDVGSNYQDAAYSSFIVPALYAQGGEFIDESSPYLQCPNSGTHMCVFPNLGYPALGWKIGFKAIKDGFPALGIPAHFAHNRKDIFHYVLFAHALALKDPASNLPKTTSGVADRPGGDLMITLGLWRSDIPENDQVGSALVQAGTLMHELGHNLNLSHAGVTRTPNCIPNYQSVMNYLYQTRGLTPLGGGDPQIDFSGGLSGPLAETALAESPGFGNFRVRYYGPLTAADPQNGAAKLHCDGTPIAPGETPMIRLENTFAGFIDWNHDGVLTGGSYSQDANFSGHADAAPFADSADWSHLNLQQVGARLNVGGLSSDVGQTDLGQTDLGQTDLGQTDLGQTDLGQTDLGQTDLGQTDLGQTDLGDIEYNTVILSTVDVPGTVTATSKIDRIVLNWNPPGTGQIQSYNIYRQGPSDPKPVLFGSVSGGAPPLSFTDSLGQSTEYNKTYTYYVTSVSGTGGSSIESNFSNAASGTIRHLLIAGVDTSRAYGSPNPASYSFNVTGLDPPAPAGVVCSTTATQGSPVGNYPIHCMGPLVSPTNSEDGITYTDATLTIYALKVTATITAFDKVYDTTTGATIKTCTLSFVLPGDSVGCSGSGSFASANAGTWTVTGTGLVLTGASAPNYVIDTTVPPTTTAKITPAPPAVTVSGGPFVYSGSAYAATCTVTGIGGVAVAGTCALSYSQNGSPTTPVNAGTYTVNASFTSANPNYSNGTGSGSLVINEAPQSITFGALIDRIFGNPPFGVSATATSGLPVSFTASGNCTVSGSAVTLTAAGSCSITANQAGDNNFLPASSVTQTFRIAGFTATGSMSTPRSFHTATLLTTGPNAGRVLVAGGFDSRGAAQASAELYDPASGAFMLTVNNMPNKAAGHTATLLASGKVLLVGGGNSSSQIYDPVANSFSAAGGIGGQRTYHTATLLGNGKVLIAGGSDNSGKTTNTALLYDPATGSYSSTGNMNAARDFHTATLLTSGPNTGKVLIAGGRTGNSPYTYLASAEIYDPAAGTFTLLGGSMTTARYGHTATPFNGKILIAGGAQASALATAELFDPAAAAAPFFTATGSLANARQFFTAFLFGSSLVATGGRNGATRLSSAEMDPASAFIAAGNMTSARAGHTATTLVSGAILIAGGEGSSGVSVTTAEVLQ